MNRQECRTKRIDSVCAVAWIPLCARDGSVIKWSRGEEETLSIHVVWTQCALGLRLCPEKLRKKNLGGKGLEIKCSYLLINLEVPQPVSAPAFPYNKGKRARQEMQCLCSGIQECYEE